MSEKVCKKHAEKPVRIYHLCVGCEIEDLRQRVKEQEELLAWFRKRDSALGTTEQAQGTK